MPMFFTLLAKKYNPYDIDNGMFAMNCAAPRSLPIVCTKMIADDGYGTATVNGKPVSKGKCVKFDFSPLPIYLLPVGEAAQDFDKTYTVKLSAYRHIDGSRFHESTFTRPSRLMTVCTKKMSKRQKRFPMRASSCSKTTAFSRLAAAAQ